MCTVLYFDQYGRTTTPGTGLSPECDTMSGPWLPNKQQGQRDNAYTGMVQATSTLQARSASACAWRTPPCRYTYYRQTTILPRTCCSRAVQDNC